MESQANVIPSAISPQEALELLKEGNRRFLRSAPYEPHIGRDLRLQLAGEQHPFAAYLSCSDSRVPPELLFGRGLGDLFIVRNAGNTLCSTALGSLEFAVTALQVPLIVVMGHENCGAIRAAMSVVKEHKHFSANINKVLQAIYPSILELDDNCPDLLDAAVRRNVDRVVHELRHEASPALMTPQKHGDLMVVGAYYHLHSGEVHWIE